MIPTERLHEIAGSPGNGVLLTYTNLERSVAAELLAARETERELVDVLRRNGFRKCDVPACNCDSWHQVDGYAARFREIDDAIGDHNGKTLLQAVQEVLAERDAARESMSLPGYQRLVDERDAARAEAKKYHDALVARHGGEPVALLSELDAARAELSALHARIEQSHNGYQETGKALGMDRPASHLIALGELLTEQVEMAESETRAALRGIATVLAASVGAEECPPVTAGNLHAVVDECLARVSRLHAECARVAKQRDELVKACSAKDDLLVCYRVGKRPSEKLFKRLDKAKRVLDAIAAEQPKPAGGA